MRDWQALPLRLAVSPCCPSVLVLVWISFHQAFRALIALSFFFRLLHHRWIRSKDRFIWVLSPVFLDFFVLIAHRSFISPPLLLIWFAFPFILFLIRLKPLIFFFAILRGFAFVPQVLLLWWVLTGVQLRRIHDILFVFLLWGFSLLADCLKLLGVQHFCEPDSLWTLVPP